ncbi:MAG: hypothetical protein KDC99_19400 [Cyclobacteriaceae bacterium]|nr:hypothetical protein [Cyclobacteriaceae bacterium]
MENQLHKIAHALQETLEASLRASSNANVHSVSKGDATEENWLKLLQSHLPRRYEASKAFVMDSMGGISDQIDIVVFDRQYTPVLYNQERQPFIPAESVYAVFEVKPSLNREYVIYAGEKVASVRKLLRTSAQITHAGGKFEPRPLFPILGGILTYDSEWKPGLGDSLLRTLDELAVNQKLDIGCAITEGAFEVEYLGEKTLLAKSNASVSLINFFFRLLAKLQNLGTVSAIDYKQYINAIGGNVP